MAEKQKEQKISSHPPMGPVWGGRAFSCGVRLYLNKLPYNIINNSRRKHKANNNRSRGFKSARDFR